MNFYIPKNNLKPNSLILIKPTLSIPYKYIRIASSSYYTVKDTSSNKVLDFGPVRTSKGYARSKLVEVTFNNIEISCIYYGIDTFEFDREDTLYFAIEFIDKNNKVIGDTKDVSFSLAPFYNSFSCKFSYQRSFIERYDSSLAQETKLEFIKAPKQLTILSDERVNCFFNEVKDPSLKKSGPFKGFEVITPGRKFLDYEELKDINVWNFNEEVLNKLDKGYSYYQYEFSGDLTGLIRLNIEANKATKIYVVFDEYLPNGVWNFARDNCSDILEYVIDKKGNYSFTSNVPYTFKHLLVLVQDDGAKVNPSVVLIQNDLIKDIPSTKNQSLDKIIEASINTYKQNAYDIFTDCPSRERAGWLCDSYFTGKAEYYYTGSHQIESNYLENYLLVNQDYLPKDMLPMCYPSNTITDNTFIPNWAMWFILELHRYFKETGDITLVNKAKDKVYGILEYFKRFENKYGLIENLESWIFIEWSKVNEDDYVKDINFPSNMCYYGVLKDVIDLYQDDSLVEKANKLKDTILKYSFDGTYFHDAAILDEAGEIKIKDLQLTETCQYYAFFFKINQSKNLEELMIKPDASLAPCAPFIGKILRLEWLFENKKYELIKDECISYFLPMANETNTLWEKTHFAGSCNHGFASIVGYYLANLK